MAGRFASIAVLACLGLHVATVAMAQQETRRPSLSDRLQRFRQDVFGSSSEKAAAKNQPNNATASRKSTSGGTRPIMIAPPGPQPALPEGAVEMTPDEPTVAKTPSSNGSGVEMPQRMQIQSARRAQSGAGPVTVITPESSRRNPLGSQGEFRSPVEETRRRALGEPAEETDEQPVAEGTEAGEEEMVEVVDESGEVVETAEQDPAAGEEASADAADEQDPQPLPRRFPDHNKLRHGDPPAEEPQPVAEPVAPAAEPEPQPVAEVAPVSDDVLFTTQSPVLAVAASGPRTVMIGKEAEFLVKVKNSGSAANNVVVKVIIPNYADVASCRSSAGSAQPPTQTEINSGLEWTIERLDSGAEETLTLKLVPRKSSPLDLAISYSFTPETSQTLVEVQEPKLAMSITGPSEVLFGQTKVYKLTISNPGNGDTQNVTVGLLPIGHSGEAPGTSKLGTLAAGESKTIDIELTARQAGAISIKAQSFADGGLRAEALQEVRVRRAELKVAVEAPNVKYAGTPTAYQLTVENTGDAMAENVLLSAILPQDAKFLAASGGRLDPQQARVTWNVGSLPAGGQRTFELQCALNAPGDNRLQVAVQGAGDLNSIAQADVRVEAIADLKLEVRDPQGPVAVGDEALYEIRIRNRGTKAAQTVDLAVFFSEGLEPVAADGAPHDLGDGQVIFHPVASIGAGDAAVFHVRARASQAGNHVFRAEVICESLNTKLAAEEATHFYGDSQAASVPRQQPTLAKVPSSEPAQPLDTDAPPTNPYE